MPVLGHVHVLEQLPEHMLGHVPKHVQYRHVPDNVLARLMLGLKKKFQTFLNAQTVSLLFRTACANL